MKLRTSELVFELINHIAQYGDLEIFVYDSQAGQSQVGVHQASYIKSEQKYFFSQPREEEVSCIFLVGD